MSKVIFKITFKHPNFKDTVKKNIGHVKYIATRPGTDKTITKSDLDKMLLKNESELLYSSYLNSDIDYVKQITNDEKGNKVITEKDLDKELNIDDYDDELIYVKYINERPRSQGLFGPDGIEDYKAVQEELSHVTGFVWRCIVSIKEEDAIKLNYTEKETWQDMLRKKIPDLALLMDINRVNLRWVAAVHMEKGHPHAHIMFWEKEPHRSHGTVSSKTLDKIRKMFTDEIFETERIQLLITKNSMRELIGDFAKEELSNASKFLKEINASGSDIDYFFDKNPGLAPRLYSVDEKFLLNSIKQIAAILPGKGRVALKLMPEEVKNKVRSVADYLLKQPGFSVSLEKNLRAVEQLTLLYTGQGDAIEEARNNAYNDIRDRICQIILKAAVESQKNNYYHVDPELARKAVDAIKGISSTINLNPERERVFRLISFALKKTGHTDDFIINELYEFSCKENFGYSKDFISEVIKNQNDSAAAQEINCFSPDKKIEFFLSCLKLVGYSESDAVNLVRSVIKNDSKELEYRLNVLKELGFFRFENKNYRLSIKGVEEFLKVKILNSTQKQIMLALEKGLASFDDLISNQNILNNLNEKDHDLKIGRFDLRIRELFGEENRITLNELENKVFEKYVDKEKAELEFNLYKNRIEKLCMNGCIKFDKETGIYSFTPEGEEQLSLIPSGMEFSKYDVNVTLTYIDKAENGVLKEEILRKMLYEEIENITAQKYYEKFQAILQQDNEYIKIDDSGNITATEKGEALARNLNWLSKFLISGNLSEENIKKVCNKFYGDRADLIFKSVMKSIADHINLGNIVHNEDGTYSIKSTVNDIKDLLNHIYKSGGVINKDNLKETLEKNIPNTEAENQFKYLVKRLEFLKKEGYVSYVNGGYSITEKGEATRMELLHPERKWLRNEIDHLSKLGFIDIKEGKYTATAKYFKYMSDIAFAKKRGIERNSVFFSKDISELIEKTLDDINIKKIELSNIRILNGKYINNEFEKLNVTYKDESIDSGKINKGMRSICKVADIENKTLHNMSTTLFVAGLSLKEVKQIIHQWNMKSNSKIEHDKINKIIDKAYEIFQENNTWGKISFVSYKDWEDMFKSLGFNEVPQWIYKNSDYMLYKNSFIEFSFINDLWKGIWKNLEIERLKSESYAEHMKKQVLSKDHNLSKSAIKELVRKNKDHTFFKDQEELE